MIARNVSKIEVEEWKKNAKEEDKKKQQAVEAKNIADSLIYTSEKTLQDNKAREVEPAFAKSFGEAREKISALKDAQKGDNMEIIKQKTQELSEAIQKVGAELYKHTEQPKTEEKPKDAEEPKADEGKYTEK
jgi:molecular chaperone DnaK